MKEALHHVAKKISILSCIYIVSPTKELVYLSGIEKCIYKTVSIRVGESDVHIKEPLQIGYGVKFIPIKSFDRMRKLSTIERQHEDNVVHSE